MSDKFGLDAMMSKITAMLARADHPATPEGEADTARAMAEKLMRKYRIEESELIAKGELDTEVNRPGSKEVFVSPAESPYYNVYYNLIHYCAQHTGVRMHHRWGVLDDNYGLIAVMVGYEADLRFAEVLFMNARIVFADRMEPKPNPELTDEENVYRMRSAGMERIRIAKLMGYGSTNSATAKVTNMYKRACKKRGEEAVLTGRSMSVTAFREAYESSFLSEFWHRLYRARNAADAGGGGELVLANRKENVDEAFYQMFPNLRPKAELPSGKTGRSYKPTASDLARARRLAGAAGQAGRSAGRNAASEIDVASRKAPNRLK